MQITIEVVRQFGLVVFGIIGGYLVIICYKSTRAVKIDVTASFLTVSNYNTLGSECQVFYIKFLQTILYGYKPKGEQKWKTII